MLTRSLAVIAVLIGTGCAPFADKIPEFQTTCEQTRQVFAEMVACIKSTVAESKLLRGRDGDLTKLYLAYADVLVEKVDGNKISDAEARLELTVVYYRLTSESKRRTSQAIQGLGQGLQDAGAAMQSAAPVPPPSSSLTIYPSNTLAPVSPPSNMTLYMFQGQTVTCIRSGVVVNCF